MHESGGRGRVFAYEGKHKVFVLDPNHYPKPDAFVKPGAFMAYHRRALLNRDHGGSGETLHGLFDKASHSLIEVSPLLRG
jgi:hypothetical protein